MDYFSERWFKEGATKDVYMAAQAQAAEKNRNLEPENELEPWDCVGLTGYRAILSHRQGTWQALFAMRYTMPDSDTGSGSYKARSAWLDTVAAIRNKIDRNEAVTLEEFEFLKEVHDWLLAASAPGAAS